jgi:cold shock protein
MSTRDFGQIIFWGQNNYGFIRPDETERDIVHRNAFPKGAEIRQGDRVSYEVGADRRPGKEPRVCAIDVRFVDSKQADAPGMYKIDEGSNGALAKGLQKLLRNQ